MSLSSVYTTTDISQYLLKNPDLKRGSENMFLSYFYFVCFGWLITGLNFTNYKQWCSSENQGFFK